MSKHSKIQKLFLLLSVSALSACGAQKNANTALTASLASAEYPLNVTPSGKIKLTDGVFQAPAAANSSAMNTVTLLTEKTVWGDVNQDGKTDAAVILLNDNGGSGTFYYLAAALNNAETMQPIGTAFLGDRVVVKTIEINAEGKITVEILTHAENAPMSAAPSISTRLIFNVENNVLRKINL